MHITQQATRQVEEEDADRHFDRMEWKERGFSYAYQVDNRNKYSTARLCSASSYLAARTQAAGLQHTRDGLSSRSL